MVLEGLLRSAGKLHQSHNGAYRNWVEVLKGTTSSLSTQQIKRAEAQLDGKLSSALHALKHRNFKLFLGGQLVSLIGNYIQTGAQAWLVYRLTGSATLLGLVAFSGQISVFVLAPISGVVADTKSRRGILFVTQIAPMLFT